MEKSFKEFLKKDIKEIRVITESKVVSQEIIDSIAEDTDDNDVFGAYIKIAKSLGNKQLLEYLEFMDKMNQKYNNDNDMTISLRYKIYKEYLLPKMKKEFKNWKDVYQAT